MRILKLHYPTGHPYWQKNEYKVELPDGAILNPMDYMSDNFGGYEIFIKDGDVYFQQCSCGSGYGKVFRSNVPAKLIVSKRQYDKIEYVGKPLVISEELKAELIENEIS